MVREILDNKHLVVVGATNMDDVVFINDHLPLDGKTTPEFSTKILGGGGMNSAIGLHLLNTIFNTDFAITLCTKIGDSPDTREILDETKRMNIDLVDVFSAHATTIQQNTVIAHKGGRSIIRRDEFNYASLPISPEYEQEIQASIKNATMVLLQTKHPRIAQIAAEAAHKENVSITVDFSSPSGLENILDYADYALLPADFRLSNMAANDDAKALLYKVGEKVPYTVVSDAHNPSMRLHNKNYAEIPSNKVETLDSLGAGDLRDAAFCYFLMREDAPDTALRKANIIASISCGYYARSWAQDMASRLQAFPEFDNDFPPKTATQYAAPDM